jgi:hypothetical protein
MIHKLMKKLWHFMHPVAQEKEMMEKFKRETERSRRALQHLREQVAMRGCYSDLLKAVTDIAGQMAWEKDLENRYVLANHLHCERFFGLDTEEVCYDYLQGRTDAELIEELFLPLDVTNTFYEISGLSDNFTMERACQCYFLESIKLKDEELLFFVIKVPAYKDGKLQGTIGTAHDCTPVRSLVMSMLDARLSDDTAQVLYKGPDVFCYYLEPAEHACRVFTHMCPGAAKVNRASA